MAEGAKLGAAYLELSTDGSKLTQGLAGAKTEAERAGGEAGSAFARSFGDGFQTLGKMGAIAFAGITAGAVAGGLAAGKLAIDFESAFAGVRKTVDATEAEFGELERGIRDMAKEIPVSANELSAIAEAGGQLGIAKENLLDFTRTMAMVAETTNLTSEEAATSFAQLANISGMAQEDIDNLASTVVALGNAGASTEADITAMALRIAGAGSTVGMTEPQIVGFAAALADVGIEAEAGGSAISRVMVDMASSVAEGGEKLEGFAAVAGMSASQFATAFREDPANAIVAFIGGLGDINEAGGNVFGTLDELELSEVRVRDALLRLSGNSEGLAQSLGLADEAWQSNTALQDEAAKRFETTASQMQLAKNAITDVGITLGTLMLPAIGGFAAALAAGAEGLSQFIADVQELGLAGALLQAGFPPELVNAVTAIGAAIASMGTELADKLVPILQGFVASSEGQVAAFGALAAVFGLLAVATAAWVVSLVVAAAPVIAIVAAVALLGAGVALLIANWDAITAKVPALGVALSGVQAIGASLAAWFSGSLVPAVMGLVDAFASAGSAIIGIVSANWGAISQIIGGMVTVIVGVISGWITGITAIISGGLQIITGIVNVFTGVLTGDWSLAWEGIQGILSGAVTIITGLVSGMITGLQGIISGGLAIIEGYFTLSWDLIKGAASTLKDEVVNRFTELKDGAIEKAGELLSWLGELPGKILAAIGDVGGLLLQAGKDLIQGFIDGMKSIPIPNPLDMVPGGGLVKGAISKVPGFAVGVSNFGGGLALVGEQGPELISLPRGADVFTATETSAMLGGRPMSLPLLPQSALVPGGNTYNVAFKPEIHGVGTADDARSILGVLDRWWEGAWERTKVHEFGIGAIQHGVRSV